MPIIKHLISLGVQPVFAGNEFQIRYIKENFGEIETVYLWGYDITFAGNFFQFFFQIPTVFKKICAEHQLLLENLTYLAIDGIISDNRYGLFHSCIPCVILTHQLRVQSNVSYWFDSVIQNIHYRYLNRFNAVWVVDSQGSDNLAGELSQSIRLPKRTEYIGLLSQFADDVPTTNTGEYILILLSGVEPQRSILSEILWAQLQTYSGEVVFVEGRELSDYQKRNVPPNIKQLGLVTQSKLKTLIFNATIVVCRSGYSTIMDLIALNKQAILIPTPGQTEQIYLGRQLHKRNLFYCAEQKNFNLANAIIQAKKACFTKSNYSENSFNKYKEVVKKWVEGL